MSASRYTNPDAKRKLDAKRQELAQKQQRETVQTAAEAKSAKQTLAEEPQPAVGPDEELPDLRETYEAPFRGRLFAFYEFGAAQLEATKYDDLDDDDPDVDRGTELAAFIYETLGEKAVHPGADEAYWRQYDPTDLIALFVTLVEEQSDLDPSEREEIENL